MVIVLDGIDQLGLPALSPEAQVEAARLLDERQEGLSVSVSLERSLKISQQAMRIVGRMCKEPSVQEIVFEHASEVQLNDSAQ